MQKEKPVRDSFNAMLARPRRLIPAMGAVYDRLGPYSYAFMRFWTGVILVPHGVQKVFATDIGQYVASIGRHGLPFPYALAVLTYTTEFAGAICLAIGLFTRLAAAMICIQMLVITFVFQ
jgi:putative oxidoreductase